VRHKAGPLYYLINEWAKSGIDGLIAAIRKKRMSGRVEIQRGGLWFGLYIPTSVGDPEAYNFQFQHHTGCGCAQPLVPRCAPCFACLLLCLDRKRQTTISSANRLPDLVSRPGTRGPHMQQVWAAAVAARTVHNGSTEPSGGGGW
jgi:hypothetical protein